MSRFEKNFRGGTDESKASPVRLRAALALMRIGAVGKLTVSGTEHFQDVPSERKLILAATHLTDIDMPITAMVASRHADVAITHTAFLQDRKSKPGSWACLKIAGSKNFFPIDRETNGQDRPVRQLDLGRFSTVLKAMEADKAVVVAAHRPSTREFGRPGIAVPYLAAAAGALILPVAVKVSGDERVGMGDGRLHTLLTRPDVAVAIGEPIELSERPDVAYMQTLLGKREEGLSLDGDEVVAFRDIARCLKGQGAAIVQVLQDMTAAMPEF